MLRRSSALTLFAFFSLACSPSRHLVVQLSTDYAPFVEFDAIDVEAPLGDTPTSVPLRVRGGYATAARLVDRLDVAPGEQRVRVTLRRGGSVVEAQTRRASIGEGMTFVTVRIGRSCAGVTCDQPEASACLAGTCTSDRCTPENPGACPTPSCHDASTCPGGAVACAAGACAPEGVCVVVPDDGRCAASEVCDPTRGCVAAVIPDAGPADAGAPDAGPADAGVLACFADDFADGDFSDWMDLDGGWMILPTGGPDGSPAVAVTFAAGNMRLTHASLRGITPAAIAFSFRLDDGVDGDLDLYLLPGGWTDPDTSSRYDVGLHAVGTDNVSDFVIRWDGSVPTMLAETPVTVAVGTWHDLDVTRDTDGSLHVRLDGAPYLDTPPDGTLAPPFDAVFRAYRAAALDGVAASCAP